MPERNESTADRVVRGLLGAFLLGAVLLPRAGRRRGALRLIAAGTALVLGVTAITGSCGVYRLLGISTYRNAGR